MHDGDCPNGLSCNPQGVCTGAKENQTCGPSVACDEGLTCVTIGGTQTKCLQACNLFTPQCSNGEICIKLTFADSPSLVFDQGAPLGVCYPPVEGARGYHEECGTIVCEPNLECVPDSASRSTCKTYCDPEAPFCTPGEKCHAWPGDYSGHQYGLCYPNDGYHDRCKSDHDCRQGMRCLPGDDPTSTTADNVGLFCAFASGAGTALAPCKADSDCGSGSCRADPGSGPDFQFCFGACSVDADCSVDGRIGLCDTSYVFTTTYNPAASVEGCRPTCQTPLDCAGYGAQPGSYTCMAQPMVPQGIDGRCQIPTGTGVIGSPCTRPDDCREGLCLAYDGRGVSRAGMCTHPCRTASDCSSFACEDRSIFVWAGADGLPGTGDDVRAHAPLCGGSASCNSDADCAMPFNVCAVDVDPMNPNGQLLTACRAPATGTRRAGDACTSDADCRSGACADLVPPSTGMGRTCLEPCSLGAGSCGQGLTCRTGAARIMRPDGTTQNFTACVP
jgi:hypothetical protein